MSVTAESLRASHCKPCEGGITPLSIAQAQEHLRAVPTWQFSADGQRLVQRWRVRDFAAALDFFQRIAQIAEAEDHHPDLHLTGYRDVTIELTTHAIQGLSENDFILAAKIDQVPVALKGQ